MKDLFNIPWNTTSPLITPTDLEQILLERFPEGSDTWNLEDPAEVFIREKRAT